MSEIVSFVPLAFVVNLALKAATAPPMCRFSISLPPSSTIVAPLGSRSVGPPLIRRRCSDAAGAGCRLVLAEAGELPVDCAGAAHNLQRAGFVEAGRKVLWRPPVF